jgi:hypothetical protein
LSEPDHDIFLDKGILRGTKEKRSAKRVFYAQVCWRSADEGIPKANLDALKKFGVQVTVV